MRLSNSRIGNMMGPPRSLASFFGLSLFLEGVRFTFELFMPPPATLNMESMDLLELFLLRFECDDVRDLYPKVPAAPARFSDPEFSSEEN